MPYRGHRPVNRKAVRREKKRERLERRHQKIDARQQRELDRRTVDETLPPELAGVAATLNRGGAL